MARHGCECLIYPTGSIAYIPWMCSGSENAEQCGQPAVDYRIHEGRTIWYCAKHWDRFDSYRQTGRGL